MRTRTGIAMIALTTIVGCGSSRTSVAPEAPTQAPTGEAKLEGKLEVVAFKGGYDIDFYEKAGKELAANHPGLTVEVTGDPKVWERLRPRLVAGSPPDIMFPGWDMDQWALVNDGQLLALDDALDSPPASGKGTWRETFLPGLLKLGQQNGTTYMLPLYVMIYGWWYDPGVFAKNGWAPPRDWKELLALGKQMKAKGIAPITYQGQYPYYMIEGMLLPWACSIGGIEAVQAAQDLEPGAWKSEPFLKAAQMIVELRDLGYLQSGATGMSHTISQSEFLNGKAGMIPCGSWLESEMKEVMPPGAKIAFMLPPVVPGGKGDPTAVMVGVEPWMIPKDAKNPEAAVAYFKHMTSLAKAKEFVTTKGSLMAIAGSDEAEMSPTLMAPARTLKSSKTVWSVQYKQWYRAMQTDIEGALTSMLNKQLTPEQFCDRCEAAAEAARNDKSVTKHKVSN